MAVEPDRPTLGERLRALRTEQGLSLREVERRSGINSGYLSQLERNEIANPTPSVLNKVAAAYDEPFTVLMRWAGYVEDDTQGLSPNAQRALNLLGDDFTDEELAAIKGVLNIVRRRSDTAAFSAVHRTDLILDVDELTVIRRHAMGVLREMDAFRSDLPVDLDEALAVARLVKAGVIELTLDERRRLRERFRDALIDVGLAAIQGIVHLDRNEVYVKPDMHEMRKRFVLGHEIGHKVLPDHRLVFAHLETKERLSLEFNDRLERQANQFSIELLSKGDQLRQEFDDSPPSLHRLRELADDYAISLQATARHLAEESKQAIAIAVAPRAFTGDGPLLDRHTRVFCSQSFETRMRWHAGRCPRDEVRRVLRSAAKNLEIPTITFADVDGDACCLSVETLDARYAEIALFMAPPKRRWSIFARN